MQKEYLSVGSGAGGAMCQIVKYTAHGEAYSFPMQQLLNHIYLKMSTAGLRGEKYETYSVAS